MGLLQLLDPYFAPLDRVNRAYLGQVVWAPVPQLEKQPLVMEADRVDDKSHDAARARLVPLSDRHFRRREGKQLPVLSLHLGETEELLAFKAKRRPAIIVGMAATALGGLEKGTPRHHEEERFVVAPVYGLRTEEDSSGFGAVLATRVRYLLYRQFFPFAQWKERRRDVVRGTSLAEGVVRLDRLHMLMVDSLTLLPVKLADRSMAVLHHMLWAYLHAEPHKELVEIQDAIREYLPEEARP